MKAQAMIGTVALLMLSAGADAGRAQAYAVGANGQMQQEKQATAIAPENQATTEQLGKLFEVMRIKQQMQSVRQMVPSLVAQQIQTSMKQTMEGLPAGSKPTAEQRERMQQLMTKYVGKSMDLYPTDEMLTDMTAIYQKHLSKDDVDGLIAFYSSPPGQHLLDAQPVISQEYMPLVMGKVSERSRVLTQEMMKEMAAIAPSTKPGGTKPAAKQGTTKPKAE
ncbi:MAG: DUF2059 domain-containing protein [Terracidiphilus sp.]